MRDLCVATKRAEVIIASAILAFASTANAQSVSNRVTGTVSDIGSIAGQTSVGSGPSESHTLGNTDLPTSSLVGGDLPGGVKMKLGDKVINLRGNVGIGDNGGNVKAGVGLPF